jgi:hypothetical protein
MLRIDLCKLRPGDVIFSRAPAWTSRFIALATASPYSHAMIVVYPDVWFETDGAGSGFKIIDNIKSFDKNDGKYAIVFESSYKKIDILRPAKSIKSDKILEEIKNHIALTYPNIIQFLPLFFPLRYFPNFSGRLVSCFSAQSKNGGGYCSQMVSQILRNLYGISLGGQHDHISPGMLRRQLLRSCSATSVDCFKREIPEAWKPSDKLDGIYRNLLTVTSKLKAYQYPHDRASFEKALGDTFKEVGIGDDPKKFEVPVERLRATLTNQKFFRMHEEIWAGKYT